MIACFQLIASWPPFWRSHQL